MRNLIDTIDNITLEVLSTRLKNLAKPLDILKWLSNFEAHEHKRALKIAMNLNVYTSYEIEEIIQSGLHAIYPILKKNEILLIHPIGNFGKSGSMVTYFFQKTDYYRKYRNKIEMVPTFDGFDYNSKKIYKLILVDDFVGSGRTVIDSFEKNIEPLKGHFSEINFIGIAAMDFGYSKIKKHFDHIEIPQSNIFKKAFSSEASYFGYRNYKKYRDLSYKYGQLLTGPTKIRSNGTKKFYNAHGFDNSQALIAFAHGSPNNTLPIIWGNKNGWVPLIPRFFPDKVSVSKQFRKSISYELSILKEFGSENIKDEFFSREIKRGSKVYSTVTKIDFSIYAIIKLSRSGFNEISICHRLGILTKDYEEILSVGGARGIFKDGNKLTDFGKQLYYEAQKCIRMKKRNFEYEAADYFRIRDINYLPKKFNGKS